VSTTFTVLIDLDSTTYDILTPTFSYLKTRHNIVITPEKLKGFYDWPEDSLGMAYGYWSHEGFFSDLKPFSHAKSALYKVYNWGVRQLFVSTLVSGRTVAWDKGNAIDRDFPFIGRRNLLLTGHDKDIVRGDMLFDDALHNLEAFDQFDYQATVLARLQPTGYNEGYEATYYKYPNYIMTDWRQYPDIVAEEMRKRG